MRYLLVPVLFLLVSLVLVQQGITNPGFPGNTPPVAGPAAPLPRIISVGGVAGWVDNLTYATPYNGSSFCFAHISDFQLQDPWSQDLEPIRAALRNIDEITPAFAVVTGDLSEYSWPSEWELYKSLERTLTVPVYPAPGNHDKYGDPFLAAYRALIGPPNYTFKFLGHSFIALDTDTPRLTRGQIPPDELRWLEGEFQRARDSKAGMVAAFGHHGPVQHPAGTTSPKLDWLPRLPHLRDGRGELAGLLEKYRVDLYLSGHEHVPWEERRGPTLFLLAGNIGGKPFDERPIAPTPVHGYRLVCVKGGSPVFTEEVSRDGGLMVNRSADGREVRIRNHFASDYPLALVRFPVCGNEPVEGGFVQAIDRRRESCTTYVGTTLPAGRERVVRILS